MANVNSLSQIQNADVQDKRAAVNALKMEIALIRDGRYNPPAGHPRESPRYLRDSITCPNVTLPDDRKEVDCDQCILHRFLPEDHPHQATACYDIPLTQSGETLAQLELQGDTEKTQAALLSWLYKTVAKLEAEISLQSTAPEPVRVHAGVLTGASGSASDRTSSSCNEERRG